MIDYRLSDDKAERIRDAVVALGTYAVGMLSDSLRSLASADRAASAAVCRADDEADRMHRAIHADCAYYVAGVSPLAKDLRFIATSLQVATNLERIADGAVEVAMAGALSSVQNYDWPTGSFCELGESVIRSIRDAIAAFAEGNVSLARQVYSSADAVHVQFRSLVQEVAEKIRLQPDLTHAGVRLILAVHTLERAADHAVNIAAWVIDVETGQHPYRLPASPCLD